MSESKFPKFVHSVEYREILSPQNNISSTQLFSSLFSKRFTYFHVIFAKNAWERISVIFTLWVEKHEMPSHRNFFREISSFVTSLVKMMLPRSFCQKYVRVNFRHFHCLRVTVWKLRKFAVTLIWQKFRESNVFTKIPWMQRSKVEARVSR